MLYRLLFLVLIPIHLSAGVSCVLYEYDKSYVDPFTQHTILRFNNQCVEAKKLHLCAGKKDGFKEKQTREIPGQTVYDLDVGILPKGAVFYYSDDGKEPQCP